MLRATRAISTSVTPLVVNTPMSVRKSNSFKAPQRVAGPDLLSVRLGSFCDLRHKADRYEARSGVTRGRRIHDASYIRDYTDRRHGLNNEDEALRTTLVLWSREMRLFDDERAVVFIIYLICIVVPWEAAREILVGPWPST